MSATAVGIDARVLESIPLLRGVPPHAIGELIEKAQLRRFSPGRTLVHELEAGDEVLILVDGSGTVTVGGMGDDPPVEIGVVHRGDCVGEMALFTGELRSATIVARTEVTALVIGRDSFFELMRRHPTMAEHLANVLAARLRRAEETLAVVFDPTRSASEHQQAISAAKQATTRLGVVWSLRIAAREFVLSRWRELPFLLLVTFLGALVTVRGVIALERMLWPNAVALEAILRASYMTGLLLLCVSGTGALLVGQPAARRWVCALFGVGVALLFNALPVLLTFDLFYVDIFTPDRTLTFSIETLYRRAEGANIAVITLCALAMVVTLRGFVRRLWHLLVVYLRRRLHRVGS